MYFSFSISSDLWCVILGVVPKAIGHDRIFSHLTTVILGPLAAVAGAAGLLLTTDGF